MAVPIALTEIGKYQVVDRLAKGGMGTLYLGRDNALDRLVAIKVLHGDFENEELRERFSREARSISRLRHPNIVTIFEYGDLRGQPFIAMEYISGESLAEVIRRRASLPIARKLQMMEEVCAGMGYAHRAKIIHRDLKPANIMIDAEGGLIKILDFGIARTVESDVTRVTQVVGTPSYMSPEQALAKRVDHRTDIFSIGAVFYELLSNSRAFDGDSQVTIVEKIQREEPVPLAELCPGLHSSISSIVNKALEKDPDRRYQDLDAMRAEISYARHWIGQSAQEAAPPGAGSASMAPRPASKLEQRRVNQINQHLEAAQAAIEKHDYEAAIESCEQVLLLDEMDARALAIIESAHAALEDASVLECVRRARDFLNVQALTDAEAALTAALKLRASDPAALALQRELYRVRHERERARERGAAAELALARARVCFAEGAFEPAARAASEALAYLPDSQEASDLKERALVAVEQRAREEELQRRVAEALDVARRRFDAGEHAAAIADLESFTPSVTPITTALDELRHRREALERQQREEEERRHRQEEERRLEQERQARLLRSATLVRSAQSLVDAGDFDGALQSLGELERVDAANPDRARLRELALSRQAAARAAVLRQQQLTARVAAGTQHLAERRLDEAQHEAEAALHLDPTDVGARQLHARVQDAVDERRRLEAIERRARAVVSEAQGLVEQGDLDRAVALLEQCELPHAVVTATLADVRALRARISAALSTAERRFASGDHDAAIRALEEVTPSTPQIAAALADIRQRIRAAELQRAEAERRQREDEERRRREHADERRRAQERKAIQQQVATLTAAAVRLVDESDFDGALKALAEAEKLDAASTDVVRCRELALSAREEQRRRQEEAARLEAQQKWLADQLREARLAGEQMRYDVALRLLDNVEDKRPGADGVTQLRHATLAARSRHQEEERRQKEIEQNLSRARTHINERSWLPALHDVERALSLESGNATAATLRETIIRALDEARRLEENAERERARRREEQRRSDVRTSAAAAVEQALARREIERAEIALAAAERELGPDANLASLRARIEAVRALEAREAVRDEALPVPPAEVITPVSDARAAEEVIVRPRSAPSQKRRISFLAAGGALSALFILIVAVALRRNASPETPAAGLQPVLVAKRFGPPTVMLPGAAGAATRVLASGAESGAQAPVDVPVSGPNPGSAIAPAPAVQGPVGVGVEAAPTPAPPSPPPPAPLSPPPTPVAPSVDERLGDLFGQFQLHRDRGELDEALKAAEEALNLRRDDQRFLAPLDAMFNDAWRSAADAQVAGARDRLTEFAPGTFARAADALGRARGAFGEGQRVAAIRSARLAGSLFRDAAVEGRRNRQEVRGRDEKNIQDLLQQYKAAYEQKDAATVARLSGLSERDATSLKNAWKTRRNVSVALQVGPLVFSEDGQQATAVCQRNESFDDVGGHQTNNRRITFAFAKAAGIWQVRSSTADPIR
jgi:hypothetical protein